VDELLAMLIALFVGRRGRETARGRKKPARRPTPRVPAPQAPPVNRLVDRLKATSRRAVASPPQPFEPPEAFAVTDMSFADDVLVRSPRRKPTRTLATLRSSQGLLGAIVASEILAPPVSMRDERRGI
jgi:hypothetical protein